MELAEPLSDQLPPATGLSAPPALCNESLGQRPDRNKLPAKSPVSMSRREIKSSASDSDGLELKGRVTKSPKIGLSGGAFPMVKRSATTRTTTRPATAAGKSLVPASERPAYPSRSQKDLGGEKWDITPDGGSAGREGRQFRVANVGNNGKIYLRPTIRPAHQRTQQPQFTFPITPPGTAGLETLDHNITSTNNNNIKNLDLSAKAKAKVKAKAKADDEGSELHISQWTPTPVDSTFPRKNHYFSESQELNRPVRHRRALSESTIHDVSMAQDQEAGAFKIVISKPGDDKRPKTMDDYDPNAAPFLDINIPSWKIGTPRFSVRGTPMIRGTSYAPTDEHRNSGYSLFNRSQSGEVNSSHHEVASTAKRPSTLVVPQIRFSRSLIGSTHGFSSPRQIQPMRSTYFSSHHPIEAAMFDALTFKPHCDDRTIVRYSPVSGAVTAATPSRLVAEITSPSFLDYDLISDFFLTFRAFLEPADLLRMLVARLRWALTRDDETGMVVRVRTFVALRHWILNYFMDDFLIDYNLRLTFCTLLNDFVDELSQCPRSRKVQFTIVTELKKCWRRVCALYWDGPQFDDNLEPDVAIAPGGVAGHRDPSLDPSFWEREGIEPPRLDSIVPLTRSPAERSSFSAEVSRAGHIGDSVVGDRPSTPEEQYAYNPKGDRGPGSPTSMASLDIVSCSFPSKALRSTHNHQTHPLAAHPVSATSLHNQSGTVATTPQALVGKRVRANPAHKRNNSLTDSLRDHGSDKVSYKDQDFLMSTPYAGSLVRGNLLPPTQAFVDVGSSGPNSFDRHTRYFEGEGSTFLRERIYPGAMSGNGMKKLIGSVRRALSTRGQGPSSAVNMSHLGPRGATTNRLPGTAVVPQRRHRPEDSRPAVRIDLLGAEVADDFRKAVQEEAAAEAERRGFPAVPPSSAPLPATDVEYSVAHMDTSTFNSNSLIGTDENGARNRPISDMAITVGSKSIVIVDDTVEFDSSGFHGLSPSGRPSVEAFAEKLVRNGTDPTPPNTPPAIGGTPRRSSYLINQHMMRPLVSHSQLPPFVPDFDTLGPASSGRASEDRPRLSFAAANRSSRHPPVSFRGHARNPSNWTHQSLNSVLQRRNSYSSNIYPHSVSRSFDATTTYSEGSVMGDGQSDAPMPPPLRVLRRRPGGDLRAVTNVGELDPIYLQRSRSHGSLTTYNESVRDSFAFSPRLNSFGRGEVLSIDYSEPHRSSTPTTAPPPQQRGDVFSLGQLADRPPRRDLSLFSTHSSKPIMRPSFEVEAQKLAQIPDDEDDGGIESTLLKLEGKFQKRTFKLSMEPLRQNSNQPIENQDGGDLEGQKKEHRHRHVVDEAMQSNLDVEHSTQLGKQEQHLAPPTRPVTEAGSFLSEASGESYSSLPLLERGLTEDTQATAQEWANISILQGSEDDLTPRRADKGLHLIQSVHSDHPSYEFVRKTSSMEKIKPGETAPQPSESQSFLNDESDLSSEFSADGDNFDGSNYLSAKSKPPSHPLASPSPGLAPKRNPPSPPISLVQALEMVPPGTVNVPQLHDHQVWPRKPLPPTPDTTPTALFIQSPNFPSTTEATSEALRAAPRPNSQEASRKYSVHLPFILAFDSAILAQQFTLIEKDALIEIDWKELIEMNWKNATNNISRSWVDFLRNTDAHGVEVVVARFNIMVKWTVSEIVLTKNISERVRCIVKFIHIAAHCRRYRNFATLAQLTIALTSNEVSRLTKTWSLVPQHDLNTLRDLENLVTPSRNFYNLRAEMEVGSDSGCIPFVGIYTHDLLYNAQRPSEIASSPTTSPLVNFERCRIAATVVKTLLRLLEASTWYSFQPIEGITERCLWMSALSDEEIRQHSEILD